MVYSQIWLNRHRGDHHVFLHFRINAFFSGEISPFFDKEIGRFCFFSVNSTKFSFLFFVKFRQNLDIKKMI